MSDRKKREQWTPEHREAIKWTERVTGLLLFAVGSAMCYWGGGFVSYAGAGTAAVGIFMLCPPFRPLFSKIVDRLPFLSPTAKNEP